MNARWIAVTIALSWSLTTNLAAQTLDFSKVLKDQLPTGAPFATSQAECNALATHWSGIMRQVREAHDACLALNRSKPNARPGKSCSFAACEHFHRLLYEPHLISLRDNQLAQCRSAVAGHVQRKQQAKKMSLVRRADPKWESHIRTGLLAINNSCEARYDRLTPCNVFVGEALSKLYGIEDFRLSDNPLSRKEFLLANEVADYVVAHRDQWAEVGNAYDQTTLARAQSLANEGYAVIALQPGTNQGHVALVMPGTLQRSSSWRRQVPNSASMFFNRPQKMYVGRMLSHAWSASNFAGVRIYYRKR